MLHPWEGLMIDCTDPLSGAYAERLDERRGQAGSPQRFRVRSKLLHGSVLSLWLLTSSVFAGQVPGPPGKLCANDTAKCTAPASTQNGKVHWHPGHYVSTNNLTSKSRIEGAISGNVTDEVLNDSKPWKGLAVRIPWAMLEGGKGDYGPAFAAIDGFQARLRPARKSFIIQILTQLIGSDVPCKEVVPAYLCSDSLYGGGTVARADGASARMWDPDVADRFIELISAICSRYADDAYFEGITGTETALNLGQLTVVPADFSWDAYYAQFKRVNDETVRACPTINNVSYINFGGKASYQYDLVAHIAARQGVMGGPDIFRDKYTAGQVAYIGQAPAPYDKDLRGAMGAAFAVQYRTYQQNDFDVQGIYDAGLRLKSTHIMWQPPPSPYTISDVSKALASKSWAIGTTDCPRNYSQGCDTRRP